MDVVISRAKMHDRVNKEMERLNLFGNSIFVDIYYAFVDYRPGIADDSVVKWIVMQFSSLNAWTRKNRVVITERIFSYLVTNYINMAGN